MRTVAIVPAAGSGNRMGRERSKQYLSLGGMPLLVLTLSVFEKCPLVDALIVVVPPRDVEAVRTEVLPPWNLKKLAAIVPGGKERQDSVRSGIEALDRLVEEGRMGPVVAAFPDCFTSLGGNQYIDSAAMGRWEGFLIDEMLPRLEAEFRLLSGREHRAVIGKS